MSAKNTNQTENPIDTTESALDQDTKQAADKALTKTTTRFSPGKSGNRKGRPPKKTILDEFTRSLRQVEKEKGAKFLPFYIRQAWNSKDKAMLKSIFDKLIPPLANTHAKSKNQIAISIGKPDDLNDVE